MLRFDIPDGPSLLIRPIAAGDKPRLSAALARLSAETIRRRFLAAKPRLSSTELRYLTEIDGRDHIALVAVRADDAESIVAVARCVRLPEPDGATAEMAIVIADELRGRGLGRFLGRCLTDAARAAGIERFAATTLGENLAARRLMLSISERLASQHTGDGRRELVVELAA